MADLNGLVRYRDFRFLVLFEGDPNPVAGVNTVGALRPGQVGSGPITLEHGLTSSVQFEEWANEVWDLPNAAAQAGGREVSLEDPRKDITIERLNEAGQVTGRWGLAQRGMFAVAALWFSREALAADPSGGRAPPSSAVPVDE